MASTSRRNYTTVHIREEQISYNNDKNKRRSFWRLWRRFTCVQKIILSLALILIGLFIFLTIPEIRDYYNKQAPSGMEVDMEKNLQQRPIINELNVKMKPVAKQPVSDDLFDGPENSKQQAIVDAFKHAWSAYKKYAWGYDELRPVTKDFTTIYGVGLTIIDSLDTMWIMGLRDEFRDARDWVQDSLTFDVKRDVNLFEITIRCLGGLLSSYHLTQDEIFLEKAKDLGDRLLSSFNTHSKLPGMDVNLNNQEHHSRHYVVHSNIADVTSMQLELTDLSLVTGDDRYGVMAKAASHHVHALPKKNGLVPVLINVNTGDFEGLSTLTVGKGVDSYYEYLLKQWLQTGKTDKETWSDYNEAVNGMKKYLLKESLPGKLLFIGELLGGETFSPKMDHFACFLGGTLALGTLHGLDPSHLEIGKKLTETCYEMYRQMPTGLSPEAIYFNQEDGVKEDMILKPYDAQNMLRPETVESLFILYRITGDNKYREWGWKIFQSFEKYSKLPDGYSTINNVQMTENPGYRNKMETFFLGETLKYLYLLFSDNPDLLPFDEYVFNTEAHPLPIYKNIEKEEDNEKDERI